MHISLDFDKLARDPQLLALVDFQLCLDRAGSLLLAPSPSPEKLGEAHRLLDLVVSQRPAMLPAALVGWHYAVQLTRPRWGHGSDRGARTGHRGGRGRA